MSADTEAAANVRAVRHDHDRAGQTARRRWFRRRPKPPAPPSTNGRKPARTTTSSVSFRGSRRPSTSVVARPSAFGWAEGGEPWDALAEDYEPGLYGGGRRQRLRPAPRSTPGSGRRDRQLPAGRPMPGFDSAQRCRVISRWRSAVEVAERIGFDATRGRLDVSTHPFCGGSHCDDVRMTTRFHDDMLTDAVSSTMHESGHAMYEQGLPYAAFGTPCGIPSRWASTRARVGCGRTRSDGASRSGSSRPRFSSVTSVLRSPASTPGPPSRARIASPRFHPGRSGRGDLQHARHDPLRAGAGDAHRRPLAGGSSRRLERRLPRLPRAGGSSTIGAVVCRTSTGRWGRWGTSRPTPLATSTGAQIFETACEEMPGLVDGFADGRFSGLLDWLRANIHVHGRRYSPGQLCERITGKAGFRGPV